MYTHIYILTLLKRLIPPSAFRIIQHSTISKNSTTMVDAHSHNQVSRECAK